MDWRDRFSSIARNFRSEWDFAKFLILSCFKCATKEKDLLVTISLRDGFEQMSQEEVLAISRDFSHCESCWYMDYDKDPNKWWKSHPEAYTNGRFEIAKWPNGPMQIFDKKFEYAQATFYNGSLEFSSYYDAVSMLPKEERKEIRNRLRQQRK